MGEKTLVENKVPEAIRLIQKLDVDGNSPSFTAWYFYSDADEWRLLIAGPAFDKMLPKQEPLAYRILVEAMSILSLSSLSISDLKLVNTNSPLLQSLRLLIKTNPIGIIQAHFTDTTLNGVFVKEMIILRSA